MVPGGAQARGDAEAGDALKHIVDEMRGNTEAGQFKLGEMYESGEDLPKDFAGAAKIYLEIARKPHPGSPYPPVAQFKMCQFYATGSGVPLDLAEAKSWCKKATASGLVIQSALIVLGKIAEQEKNFAEAEGWYEKAILARDGRGFVLLARLKMQDGPQGERDAYYWLYLAKQFNIPEAETELQSVAARLSASDISEQEKKAYKWRENLYSTKAKTMKRP
jgi:TPR repeat protein